MQHATYRNSVRLPLRRGTAAQNLRLYIRSGSATARELALLCKGHGTDTESRHNQLDVHDRFTTNTYEDAQALVRITHLHLLAVRRKGKPTGTQRGGAFCPRKQTITPDTERHWSSTPPLKNASMESSDILRASSTLSAPMQSFIFKISHQFISPRCYF